MKNEPQLNYKVYDRDGVLKMSAPEELRYPLHIEQSLLNAGYVIKLNGKRITKKELQDRKEK